VSKVIDVFSMLATKTIPALVSAFGIAIPGGIASLVAAFSLVLLPVVAIVISRWAELKDFFIANWDQVVRIFDQSVAIIETVLRIMLENLKIIGGVISAVLKGQMDGWMDAWNSATRGTELEADNILDIVEYLAQQLGVILEQILSIISQVSEFMARHWEDIAASVRWGVDHIIVPITELVTFMFEAQEVIWSAVDGILNAISTAFEAVGEFLGFAGGGQIPGFAEGGVVRKASGGGVGGIPENRLVMVGERGPEIISAPVGSRVLSNKDMKEAIGGNGGEGGITINTGPVTIREEADIQKVANGLFSLMQQRANGQGMQVAMG
jgi:hypothetical protein